MKVIEYHNCPKHGKERCFRNPEKPNEHFCQAFNFKERIATGKFNGETLNEVLDSARIEKYWNY